MIHQVDLEEMNFRKRMNIIIKGQTMKIERKQRASHLPITSMFHVGVLLAMSENLDSTIFEMPKAATEWRKMTGRQK